MDRRRKLGIGAGTVAAAGLIWAAMNSGPSSKDDFFDKLTATEGTVLHDVDPEYLEAKRKWFGEDYNDFVDDVYDNIRTLPREIRNDLINEATTVAREEYNENMFGDLASKAYWRIQENTRNRQYEEARLDLAFSREHGRTFRLGTPGLSTLGVLINEKREWCLEEDDPAMDLLADLPSAALERYADTEEEAKKRIKKSARPIIEGLYFKAFIHARNGASHTALDLLTCVQTLEERTAVNTYTLRKDLVEDAYDGAYMQVVAHEIDLRKDRYVTRERMASATGNINFARELDPNTIEEREIMDQLYGINQTPFDCNGNTRAYVVLARDIAKNIDYDNTKEEERLMNIAKRHVRAELSILRNGSIPDYVGCLEDMAESAGVELTANDQRRIERQIKIQEEEEERRAAEWKRNNPSYHIDSNSLRLPSYLQPNVQGR